EQNGPAAAIADQELAEYQLVRQDLIPVQQRIEPRGERRSSSEKPYPDGGVDENHYAARRFARLALRRSLRRGTSTTPPSAPRTARCRAARATVVELRDARALQGRDGWCRCPCAPGTPPSLQRAEDRRCASSSSYSLKCHTRMARSNVPAERKAAYPSPFVRGLGMERGVSSAVG